MDLRRVDPYIFKKVMNCILQILYSTGRVGRDPPRFMPGGTNRFMRSDQRKPSADPPVFAECEIE